jgi:hypothetical protein
VTVADATDDRLLGDRRPVNVIKRFLMIWPAPVYSMRGVGPGLFRQGQSDFATGWKR